MSGGHFNYAYLKTDSPDSIWELLRVLRDMRDYSDVMHPRAVIHLDMYILFLEGIERQYCEYGARMRNLMQEIEWEASGDSNVDSVTKVLDCFNIPSLEQS